MRPLPFNGSRIPQAPQNHSYDHGLGFGPGLAGLPTRQIGRSANDPQRIAEQMRRRGDPSAILRFGAQQMGQDFAREQNAVNFEQGLQMFGMQQGAMDARDQRNFDQSQMQFGMQQGVMDARDERNFSQQQQLEQQRRADDERRRNAEADGRSITGMSSLEAPDGSGYVPMVQHADGTVSAAGGYMPRRAAPPAAPSPAKTEKPQTPAITWRKTPDGNEVPYQTIVDENGRASLRLVSIIDENRDGIDDRKQGGGAPAGGGSAPATKPAKPEGNAFAGTTTSGFKFSLVK